MYHVYKDLPSSVTFCRILLLGSGMYDTYLRRQFFTYQKPSVSFATSLLPWPCLLASVFDIRDLWQTEYLFRRLGEMHCGRYARLHISLR